MRRCALLIQILPMLLLGALARAPVAGAEAPSRTEDLTRFVDKRMGTDDGHGSRIEWIRGQTTFGPQMPWGTANPAPQSQGTKLSSTGFRLDALLLDGMTQNHMSGTGVGVYGHLLLRPLMNDQFDPKIVSQSSVPGHYTVVLGDGTTIEATATQHACLYRITYGNAGTGAISVNLKNNLGNAKPVVNATAVLDPGGTAVSGGFDFIAGWSHIKTRMSYHMVVSKPSSAGFSFEDPTFRYSFPVAKGEVIFVRLALAMTGEAKAKEYVLTQLPDTDFDAYKQKVIDAWNRKLGSILVSGGSPSAKNMFYTALYHTMLMPHDRTGDNPRWKSDEPYWDDHMCVWDTWRTMFPLMVLINPDMVQGVVRGFIDQYRHTAKIHDSWVAGGAGGQQGGVNPINVITDAYIKGIPGIDWKEAYEAVKKISDTRDTRSNHPSSTGIEYAYNDFCASLMGANMGDPEGFAKFSRRSGDWRSFWTGSGFCGRCYEFCNGYNFFVPHDIAALVELYGGRDAFAKKLESSVTGHHGALSNEPNFLMYHLFNYIGKPDRSSYWVRQKLKEYKIESHAYPGDEDSGAMGSWFVFSSMGIFPNAGQDIYFLTAPMFNRSTIRLGNGRTFTIEADQVGDNFPYIASATLNGKAYDRSWMRHAEIVQGGTLSLRLTDTPTAWGTVDVPPSVSTHPQAMYITPPPASAKGSDD